MLLFLEGLQEKRLHDYAVARSISYVIHVHNSEQKHRLSIYDLWPLPTDPTAEERMAIEQEKQKAEEAKALAMLAMYQQQGYMN